MGKPNGEGLARGSMRGRMRYSSHSFNPCCKCRKLRLRASTKVSIFLREFQPLARDPRAPFSGDRSFRSVDTCAAEFPARTPYYYSGWERRTDSAGARADADEVRRGERESIVILGSGPNRIGQGIEFDYCCVHAAMTVRDSGRDAVMIN